MTSAGVRLLTALAAPGGRRPARRPRLRRADLPRRRPAVVRDRVEAVIAEPPGQGELFTLDGAAARTPGTVVLGRGHRRRGHRRRRRPGHRAHRRARHGRPPHRASPPDQADASRCTSCARRRRRPPSSRRSCGGPTWRTACRGRGWRSSSAARVGRGRCGGCSPRPACRSGPGRRDAGAGRAGGAAAARPALRGVERAPAPDGYDPRGGRRPARGRRSAAATRSGLRRLRRALRAELADGGGRTSDELLVGPSGTRPGSTSSGPSPAPPAGSPRCSPPGRGRAAGAATAGSAGARSTAETVLWACGRPPGSRPAWRAPRWPAAPPGRAPTATSTPWSRCSRPPRGSSTGCRGRARGVPRAPARPGRGRRHPRRRGRPPREAVALLTPAAAAGLEWDAGRRRRRPGGRLARPAPARLAARARPRSSTWSPDGPRHSAGRARPAVRHDERRLFHVAVTRARERLLVTAVRSDDEQPSPYLDLVDPRRRTGPAAEPLHRGRPRR